MTVRYRDLPATAFPPAPTHHFERPEGSEWHALSISPGGEVFLASNRSGNDATILTSEGESVALRPPDRRAFTFPIVQRFSDGRWLVVEARTRNLEPNAFVFWPDRSFSHAFYAGDGIETVLVDTLDRIWIGYFDEGVFSSLDIPDELAPSVLGRKGLVRLSEAGELQFGFNGSAGDRSIFDIYAMTIDDEDRAWLCPYEDFFVASVENQRIDIPLPVAPVAGAPAMLVGPRHLVFFGGYDRQCIVTVVERQTRRLRLIQLLRDDGNPMSPDRVATRGTMAVALDDDRLHRLDLAVLLEALGQWHDGNSSSVDSAVQYLHEESSYAGYSVYLVETGEVLEYPGEVRPAENQPRNDDCGGT